MVDLGPLHASVTITLHNTDMVKAMEYWLNDVFLKRPVTVKEVRKTNVGFEIDVLPREMSEEIHPDDRR